MKKLGLILLIAVLASVLPGCGGTSATMNINGRGTVATQFVYLVTADGPGPGALGTKSFSLSFACYTQNNNRIQGYVNWSDLANGVRIAATLPDTSIYNFTGGDFKTCKELKAAAVGADFSVNTAGIYSENGNADGNTGTQTGNVNIIVAKPGVPLGTDDFFPTIVCDSTKSAVLIIAMTNTYYYAAGGCLDRGKIVFGSGGQNGQ